MLFLARCNAVASEKNLPSRIIQNIDVVRADMVPHVYISPTVRIGFMQISVAMTTFNGSRYVVDQLNSLAHQTRVPDELVVVDDASTDGTFEILLNMRHQLPFPMKLKRNNTTIGFIRNFGRAIGLCQGDLIFTCDQDDYWFHNRIEIVEKIFESESETLVVINDAVITDDNLSSLGYTKYDYYKSIKLPEQKYITGCCTAFRSNVAQLAAPIDYVKIPHDEIVHYIGLILGGRRLLRAPLIFHRRHLSNTSELYRKTGFLKKIEMFFSQRNANKYVLLREKLISFERISEKIRHSSAMGTLSPEQADNALRHIANDYAWVRTRLRLLSMPLPTRSVRAMMYLLQGKYHKRGGIRAFTKDCLSRRHTEND